jgi:hypothetical protein
MTLTFCTAPKGPNSCHNVLSSVSGAKLYTNKHHPAPLIVLPVVVVAAVGMIVLAPKMDPASIGENLRTENIFFKIFLGNHNLIKQLKPFLCDLPREQSNMVTSDRWSLNTGLIDKKCIMKGNKN